MASALVQTFRRVLDEIESIENRLSELGIDYTLVTLDEDDDKPSTVRVPILVFPNGRPEDPYGFGWEALADLLKHRQEQLAGAEQAALSAMTGDEPR